MGKLLKEKINSVRPTKGDITFLIVALALISQDYIQNRIGVFSYYDEGLCLILAGIAMSLFIYNRKFAVNKTLFCSGAAIFIYFVTTTLASVWFRYQSVDTAAKASFLSVKWFLTFYAIEYLFKRGYIFYRKNILYVVLIVWGIISNFYYLNNIRHLFDEKNYYNFLSPIYLCALSTAAIALLMLDWAGSKVEWLCVALMLENLIFSTKAKGYASALISIVLFVWIIVWKHRLKVWHLIVVGIACIALVWDKIYFYYIFGAQHGFARATLLSTGIEILRDNFPFGTGWGTYGSYYAQKEYSPVYVLYGLDSHGELGRNSQFTYSMDCYLASVMGESGFIGLIAITVFLLILFFIVDKTYRVDRRIYAAGLICLVYECITFLEESGFANPSQICIAIALGIIVARGEKKRGNDDLL